MATPAQVRAKLWQGGILASMDWVAACVEWLAADQPGLTREQVVLEVQQQWLDTDITVAGVMDRPVLPADLVAARVVHLPGNYVVMVEQATDVGSPAYGQLQKLHQVDVENARVGEEEGATQGQLATQATQGGRHQAAWEPRPSRALSLALTDGSQRVRGLEEAPLPQGSARWGFLSLMTKSFQIQLNIQGVPRHWTPGDLAKSQALYEIRHLENIQVSSSCL